VSSILTHSENVSFVESLYEDYLQNPQSVPTVWRGMFEEWSHGTNGNGTARPALVARTTAIDVDAKPGNGAATGVNRIASMPVTRSGATSEASALQDRVDQLVRNFRVRGHIISQVDPLGSVRPTPVELEPLFYGFTEADLDRHVSTLSIAGPNRVTLRQVIQRMTNTYCGAIGVQFMHIDSLTVRGWLQERMESTENRVVLSRAEQIRILTRLTDAVMFEDFIQKKYVGAKSFSLEGAESLIPLLDMSIEKAGEDGIVEIVLGMAHRGRLNVLANIMGKNPRKVFREFDDVDHHHYTGKGDVKYHLGFSNDWITATGKKIHLSLCFNPSHLEYVNTVALGRLRAKQDRVGDDKRRKGMTILIHGDAAFAGEGIVQETLNLSELPGYSTGGTIHIIVNNQLGFTTTAAEGRSSTYATDVARMLQIPIFHVNGENPEAVAQAIKLSMDFRKTFQRDVVIDMYCYRRRGHNEGDEPAFTQPLMYKAINARKNVREAYLDHLVKLGVTALEAGLISKQRQELLETELKEARSESYDPGPERPRGEWEGYFGGPEDKADTVKTGADKDHLSNLLKQLTEVPEGFTPHPKMVKVLESRNEMAMGKKPLDWASAESLAFATLLLEGQRIRMTGQDCQRGTFTQRHAVLHDCKSGETWTPLANLSPKQSPIELVNSPLSEAGVLGFEYGYSLDWPDGLVMWEAQFGDFCNAAQVIIDQFIASAEDKWNRLSGLVMLLPHGFEGQGPEHSSARLERFLSLAAEDNMIVAQPSTPAQYFHLLRRQALRKWRKPLVVMTPKSLLRLAAATSPMDELANGSFQKILKDVKPPASNKLTRVLMCTGRIYYDLEQKRAELKRDDLAIVRVEQLYPLPEAELKAMLSGWRDGTPVMWVQDEPENMGAWRFLHSIWGDRMFGRYPFTVVSRPASASPATGSNASHKLEQQKLLAKAFA
jgi:2-oxoglutarate dehydrogenase E1 component